MTPGSSDNPARASDPSSFYDENAQDFFDRTVNLDLTASHERFLAFVPTGGSILDVGCGSGRDSSAFLAAGYQVVAIDASQRLCDLASAHLGQPVLHRDVMTLDLGRTFDGAWACASFVHMDELQLSKALRRVAAHLEIGGVLFMSIKHAPGRSYTGEREADPTALEQGERRFELYDRKRFRPVLNQLEGLRLVHQWSNRGGVCSDHLWFNVILKKNSKEASGKSVSGKRRDPGCRRDGY